MVIEEGDERMLWVNETCSIRNNDASSTPVLVVEEEEKVVGVVRVLETNGYGNF